MKIYLDNCALQRPLDDSSDMMKTQTLDQINKKAVETLYRELGVSRTIRFLRQYRLGKGDYVKIKREAFSYKTVEDITGEILEDFPDG